MRRATKLVVLAAAAVTSAPALPKAEGYYFPRLPCRNEMEVFDVHDSLHQLVSEFLEMYDNYADPVVEVMDAVVLHQIKAV